MSTPATQVAAPNAVGWRLENTYATLPHVFFADAVPAPVREPRAAILNHRLAEQLGLDLRAIPPDDAAAIFSGQTLPPGARPIAQAYAGHQFGGFTMLGDGRAILLGEQRTPDGRLFDIQFKGSGPTLFSRRGDGLAALAPMLREYIISEAMAALGIPTTRSLAVVATGQPVFRERTLRGAILTRVAASHIRVGTFQYAAALRNDDYLRALADYTVARHYPELADASQKYAKFLPAVMDRQASLIAKWMLVGFIHGVMNTDNMALSGASIDYGPCAFMNAYRPDTVFSSIDRHGRYAYGNQPAIAQWNLARFAETLLPLIDPDVEKAASLATEALNEFPELYEAHWLDGMRRKLGLRTPHPTDGDLVQSLLDWMEQTNADFTNTFADLSSGEPLTEDRYQDQAFRNWHARWQTRFRQDGDPAPAFALMRSTNPLVIPRNHHVEEALAAAEDRDDLQPLHNLLAAVSSPFESNPDKSKYRGPPTDESCYRTFCGT